MHCHAYGITMHDACCVMLGCGAKAINDTMYTTIVIVTLWAILRSKQGLLRRLRPIKYYLQI